MLKPDEPDYTRIFFAVFLSAALLIFWQVKVEWPRRQALAQLTQQQKKEEKVKQEASSSKLSGKVQDAEENLNLTREQRIAASPRVAVHTDKVIGSIALRGARFDDISLVQYRDTIEKDSAAVTLFSPNGDAHGYFAHIGWLSPDGSVKVPAQDTLWQADTKEIGIGQPVTLSWNNGAGITFFLKITLDEHYMFTIDQRVENASGKAASLM
ncbi:MAG: membrane protein insertase YidC, partial [Proteobacteria bacterium]|nr:membrane protein insertase YidC [Pseudomonadota bacterium]